MTFKTKRIKKLKGQALLEYVLLMAGLSIVAAAFVSFMGGVVFKTGFEQLPSKMAPCLSHQAGSGGGGTCQ